jgi:hypothetical protein
VSAEIEAYSVLSNAMTVTAFTGTRIYPDFVPEDKTLPAIAINRIETEYVNTIHQNIPEATKVHLEIWCMTSNRKDAEQLGDAVELVIGTGEFVLEGRRPEFDPETLTFAVVLQAFIWQ